MKIVISAKDKELTSEVDPRFGRAKFFILVNTDDGSFEAHDNTENMNAMQGAGVKAAQKASELKAEAVITGNVGPKAFTGLEAAGVKIFQYSKNGTVEDAIAALKEGSLVELTGASSKGHH